VSGWESAETTCADAIAEAFLRQYVGFLPLDQIREIALRVCSSNEIAENVLRLIDSREEPAISFPEQAARNSGSEVG